MKGSYLNLLDFCVNSGSACPCTQKCCVKSVQMQTLLLAPGQLGGLDLSHSLSSGAVDGR